ncbi:MAG: SDR family oxidoreductase [Hyphomonadaceae bacterium]|nr:SDR family oxidoreductase [Hyphomonadaceae bacterium]
MKRLEGKRAVVTGAANGIGAAIAEKFVEEGAAVILADINDAANQALAEKLGQTAVHTDVSKKSEIDALFAEVEHRWGGLDILVNNAGVTHKAELLDLTETDFDRVFAINLKSALFGTQHAARLMKKGGAIINMSSVNAILGIPTQIPYAISKGALRQLTNVSALSLAPRGIRVNAIGPGTIATDLARSIASDKAAVNMIMSRTPLGRMGEPSEVATIAVFLACDESSYITGQTIYPDGGRLGLNYTVPVAGEQ